MKYKKPKTIKYPKNQAEAIDTAFQLASVFDFKVIALSQEDYDDQMGTENWTKKDYEKARLIALEDICDGIGYAIDESIICVNNGKALTKKLNQKN
jgi:hypothetical protein